MSDFFEGLFSKYQCGFRKGFSAQHCLIAMLEIWKSASDNKKLFGGTQAFDCLPHDVLIAKLNAYGFTMPALDLYIIISQIVNKEQR